MMEKISVQGNHPHISNTDPVESNIREMIKDLGLPHNNPSTFDDVSIIAADLVK